MLYDFARASASTAASEATQRKAAMTYRLPRVMGSPPCHSPPGKATAWPRRGRTTSGEARDPPWTSAKPVPPPSNSPSALRAMVSDRCESSWCRGRLRCAAAS